MKKLNILFILLFLLQIPLVFAQQFPNSGFETFEHDSQNGRGQRPVGWKASNVQRTVVGITAGAELVHEDANGRTGKCVYMHNEWVGAAGIGAVAPAWVTLGSPWNYLSGTNQKTASAGTDGGINFTYRPDTLSIWVKRTFTSPEDANIVVYLWKGTSKGNTYKNQGGGCTSNTTHYDEESDIRINYDANDCGTEIYATQVGEGSWRSRSQFTAWTLVKIPISYLSNDAPDKMNVILSAGNYPNKRQSTGVMEGSKMWCDDIKFIYSSVADEFLLNNRPMSGFDKNTKTYTVSLGDNATDIPTIEPKRAGRKLSASEYTIQSGGIGGTTTVTINAEDGSSSTTYSIKFVTALSKNPRPLNILVGAVAVPNFNPYVFSYNVELPYGTTSCPDITIEQAESDQTYTVTKPATIPGVARVKVFAPDVNFSQEYTINITVGVLTDNTLTGIFVNGNLLKNYKPTTNNYVVELPVGTIVAPTITYNTAYPNEHTIVVDDKGLNGGVSISVTPQGTALTRVYKITYRITASTYTFLADLKVGGETIDNFDPERLLYSYSLPLGTNTLPAITWTQGDEYQSVQLQQGGIDGETKIVVTSQSGAVSIYRINFSTAKSSISTLSNIYIDGVAIPTFAPEKVDYRISLPVGTVVMPTITWDKGDEYQIVTPYLSSLSGTSRIVVTAQDGNVKSYSISFDVAQADVSTLLDIKVGGVSVEGFDPNTLEYNIVLSRGTTVLPEITYIANDATQIIRIVNGGIEGVTRITVKAQTGATSVYILNFSVEKSTNSALNDIKVGGVSLENFASGNFNYSYSLPSGTTALPIVECVKGNEYQNIVISNNGVEGAYTITVKAENGTQSTYVINFSVEKSSSALLKMIYLDGANLRNFSPETMSYVVTLTENATQCPDITVLKEGIQTVTIKKPILTGLATIEVTPEVGGKNVYTIDFQYLKSNDAQLADITVGGISLSDFAPVKTDYVVTLPKGLTVLPSIGYTRNDKTQTIFVEKGQLNQHTIIYVKAENGQTNEYRIYFKEQQDSRAQLEDIFVNGVSIPGFNQDNYEYTYILPIDDLEIPMVECVKAHEGQEISFIFPKNEGIAKYTVVSEDKIDTAVYLINFVRTLKSTALLKSITVDNTEVLGGNKDQDTIFVDIQAGYSPNVSYEPIDLDQRVFVADAGAKGCQILVVANDGSEHTYTIVYNVQKSTVAILNDIQIQLNGTYVSLPTYDSETLVYDYILAKGTKSVPNINTIAGNDEQTTTISYGSPNGLTTIDVLAEDRLTTRQYTINFTTEKSSESYLGAIYMDGVELNGFDPLVYNYSYAMPYQADLNPVITWDLPLDNVGNYIVGQEVVVKENVSKDTMFVIVVSEDKLDTTVYNVALQPTLSAKENTLLMVTVGGKALDGFSSEKNSYTVQLPYGTTSLPKIEVIKSYDEQTVIVNAPSVVGRTTITVISNRPEVADVLYNIDFSVSTIHPMALSSISVDGVPMANFDPMKTKYVLPVIDKPIIGYTLVDDTDVTPLVDNDKYFKFEVHSLNSDETLIYELYYFYVNDIIPNADFSAWSQTVNNSKSKPTGWVAPADCANSYNVTATYTTGPEVENLENQLRLRTWSSHYSLYGGVPGMVAITGMNLKLDKSKNSTSSVSGGIGFRNTPDRLTLDYKPVSKTDRVSNLRFRYTLADEFVSVDKVFTDNNFNNTWKAMSLDIRTDLQNPRTMNIVLNSAHSENASDIGYTSAGLNFTAGMKQESEVYIDNLAFEYSNLLTAIVVNGDTIKITDQSISSYTANIAVTSLGEPNIIPIGQVEDQDYTIIISEEVNGLRNANILVKAEDGTERIYTVEINRPQSENANLSAIYINDSVINGFDASQFEYTVALPNGIKTLPDVSVMGNLYQDLKIIRNDSQIVINVTAENGTTATYTINFTEEIDAVTTLANISVDGVAISYDKNTYNYTVDIDTDAIMPKLTYEKTSNGQSVKLTAVNDTILIAVTAQNGVDNVVYQIACVRPIMPTSSVLKSLAINNVQLSDFEQGVLDYNITDPDMNAYWNFTSGSMSDVIVQTISKNLVSFAVQGDSTNIYSVNITYTPSGNTSLNDIKLNNETLEMFTPALKSYELDYNSSSVVHIRAITSDITQKLDVSRRLNNVRSIDLDNSIYEFVVTAENGIEDTTSIQFVYQKNTDVQLADILLNETSISLETKDYIADAAFNSIKMEYNIVLKIDSPKHKEPSMPTISVVAAAKAQNISVENNGINAVSYIYVTAENEQESVYSLNITTEKSNCVSLAGIIVDMQALADFAHDKYEYVVENTADNYPLINWIKSDQYQTVTIVQNSDSSVITVVSEAKLDTSIYVVKHEKLKSDIATLGNILVDGVAIQDFDKDSLEYTINLALGSNIIPDISVVSGANNQNISIENKVLSVSNTQVIITVTAENGTTSNVYTVDINIEKSTYNKLQMIYIAGEPMVADKKFSPDVNDYIVYLPIGTTELPLVTWRAGDECQTIAKDIRDKDSVIISVAPQTEGLVNIYTITFITLKSENATLNSIEIDGELMSVAATGFTVNRDFSSNVFEYIVTLPIGTNVVPNITWQKGDQWQIVNLIEAESVNDTAFINVEANDPTFTNTYKVIFKRALSQNANLDMISVDNLPLDNFSSDEFIYNYVLPIGTIELPNISWEKGDQNQNVTIETNGTYGQVKITVLAEDINYKNVYIIAFIVNKSNNANLDSIHVDGIALNGFDADVYSYVVKVPYGTVKVPNVMPFKSEANQIVSIIPAGDIKDTTVITVYAEDGVTLSNYRVSFVVIESDNALLDAIMLDGVAISKNATSFISNKDFDSEDFVYNITLPYGTTELPEITWNGQVLDYTSVTLDKGEVNGTITITVTSQDANVINEYVIIFAVAKSDNALLQDLKIADKTVKGFSPNVFEYTISFPIGTTDEELPSVDDFSFVKTVETQTVTISGENPRAILITVIAEDGVSVNVYVVNFDVKLNNNSLLESILVNGVKIQNFSSTQFEYTYLLLPGVLVPDVEAVKGDKTQEVIVVPSVVGEPTYIYVTAEDGSESEYIINFMYTTVNPGDLPTYADVAWLPMGGGLFKASTVRQNVQVRIVNLLGEVLRVEDVAVIDPNEKILEPHQSGTMLQFDKKAQMYIYVFTTNGTIISSGKFIVTK